MSIRREKIIFFEQKIADFFKKAGRETLPWRPRKIPRTGSRGKTRFPTAYEVWVSEVMLQQTQVSRVIGYYETFLKRFPDVRNLARTTWEEFLPYYQGLGYYARGRNMLRAARMIAEEYAGEFPCERKELEKLPGVGPYTAAAILSFAYGKNEIAWDTNLRRVVGRFFFGTKDRVRHPERSEGSRKNSHKRDSSLALGMTEKLRRRFSLPAKTLNAALMDFGSAICTARPKCAACSLRRRCTYFREKGRQETNQPIENNEQLTDTKKQSTAGHQPERKNGEEQVYLFLHENHRRYYSARTKTYVPFILPKGTVTRAAIKAHFQERYGLRLSVRPPHRKIITQERAIIFVNAQVLLGEPGFPVFPKKDAIRYTEMLLKK